jgi:arabinofuranosyltransferase
MHFIRGKIGDLPVLLSAVGFVIWGSKFILMTSMIAFDGERYFSLFDDAMISMRYAWNLSHGQGLTWNPGEFVEGYSNLLMVLLMSLATFLWDKSAAVLAVQVMGIAIMLGIAHVNMRIAGHLFSGHPRQKLLQILGFVAPLCYYPLVFWTLMGMETGLLTWLILSTMRSALEYTRNGRAVELAKMAVHAGLAVLTRNDSVIFTLPIWAFVLWRMMDKKGSHQVYTQISSAFGLFALFGVGQVIFSYMYHRTLLSNTYVLKLTGMPLTFRLKDGIGFTVPFLVETSVLFLPPLLHLILKFRWEKLLLISTYFLTVAYQIYIGGDPWNYWRMPSPSMPLLGLLYAWAMIDLLEYLSRWFSPKNRFANQSLIISLTLAGMLTANLRFLPEILFSTKPYQTEGNEIMVNAALALNEVTTEHATVGVFWAGALPYYTDRKAVDFLGKSDPYIAQLPADLSGAISWSGMRSVPGHNKYDLEYSIQTLQPTYVQNLRWGQDNVRQWARDKYIEVQYQGVSLILLRGSPDVLWNKITPSE